MATISIDPDNVPVLTIAELSAVLTPTRTHELPVMKSGATEKITTAQIIDILKDELLAGTYAFTGDIDLAGNALLNNVVPGILIAETWFDTSDASFDFDSRTRFAILDMGAAGGAGGGSLSTASQASAGSGGNCGSFGRKYIDVEGLTTKQCQILLGTGGTGSAGAVGSDGGDSSYIDENGTSTLAGGKGGQIINTQVHKWGPQTASNATSTGFDRITPGYNGDSAHCTGTTINATVIAHGGKGADSPWGKGGGAVALQSSSNTQAAGTNASGFCSGGGGGSTALLGTTTAGGNGGDGVACLREYM